MIEGLRALPWLEEARRTEHRLLECDFCQETASDEQRKILGCGWMEPSPSARPWQHTGDPSTYRDAKGDPCGPSTCAGYTTRLPDVLDAVSAWAWWDKGQLDMLLTEDKPSASLIDGIEEFAGALGSYREWKATPEKDR